MDDMDWMDDMDAVDGFRLMGDLLYERSNCHYGLLP